MKHIASTIVRAPDIALNNNLFGGTLLRWLDEYGALFVYMNLNHTFITSWMGDIHFTKTAHAGDRILFYVDDLTFHRAYVQFTLIAKVKDDRMREIIHTSMKFVPIDKATGKIVRMNPFLFERDEFEQFVKQRIDADVSTFEAPGRYGDANQYKQRYVAQLYKQVYGDTAKAIKALQQDYGKIIPATLLTLIINKMEESNE